MDSVVNAALEEICAQVEDGLTLEALWPKLEASASASASLHLQPPLSLPVKKAIWTNLLRIPTLRFQPHPSNPNLEFDNSNLKIFPHQTLSDNFLGLYDSQSLQNAQIRVLQLLANARHNGITQTQLAKNLRIDPNNYFYVLSARA